MNKYYHRHLIPDYLNSNFTSVSVDFELSEEEDVYIIIDGQKYQLFENRY